MQYVIYVIFLLVSVVGLAEIMHFISLKLLTKKGKNNKILFCFLSDEGSDFELKYIAEQYKWHGKNFADEIVAISLLEDDELRDKCMNIAKKNDIILIDFLNSYNNGEFNE